MKQLTILALGLALTTLALAGEPIEKTIPVPKRDQDVKIGVSGEGAKVVSVTIQNFPDSAQVEKAKSSDPNDKSFVFWNFEVANTSDHPVKIKVDLTLIGKDGEAVGRTDKSDTVEAGKTDDNIRLMMHPKILDLVNGKEVKLKISFETKK